MRNSFLSMMAGALVVAWPAGAIPAAAQMADAARRGDAAMVRHLLEEAADVNVREGDGMTALHWAAKAGHAGIAEALIHAGAHVDELTRLGAYTPLHLASQGGHARIVQALLAAGAEPNARTSTGGATPLHFAAESGNVEAIVALLDGGADANAREGQWGNTPLMFAAARDRAAAVEQLLSRGADPAVTGRVIDIAKRSEEDREAQSERNLAMGCGAGENERARRCTGFGPSAAPAEAQEQAVPQMGPFVLRPMGQAEQIGHYGGLTALTLAAREGNARTALALLDGGADIDQPTAGDHTTPLLMAVINGHFDLAMTLLERGADVTLASHAGNTPLFAAINRQWAPKSKYPHSVAHLQQSVTYLELMEALLEAGADVNARLHYDVWHIELGGDHLDLDWIGATPFLRAAHGTDVDAMKLLVRYGADPNIPTIRPAVRARSGNDTGEVEVDPSGLPPVPPGGPGVYPIHAAVGYAYGEGNAANVHRHKENGWLPAAMYLVEAHGADVNARDYDGNSVVHHAAARGDNELILYLVDKGADVMSVNRKGQTTVDLANGPTQRIQPFPETIRLLEGLGAKNNHTCVTC